MNDEDYRLKIESAAQEEEGNGFLVGCLVIAAMVSALALALVLGLAFFSFMAVL